METPNRDTAQNAVPQDSWQDAEPNASITQNTQSDSLEATIYNEEEDDEHIHAMAGIDAPDPDDEDDEDDEDEDEDEDDDDEEGDWGHVDPAEGNSPFPDSNDPSGPGSAV